MKRENVLKAIAVMERVRDRNDTVNMICFQRYSNLQADHYCLNFAKTEQELHNNCGSAACFAGWIAVSPEFKADGGEPYFDGRPVMGEHYAADAIAHWLGISGTEADTLVYYEEDTDFVYGKPHKDVQAADVLKVLYRLHDTGSIYPNPGVP